MAGLADWLEDYRNWRGRQDWESGKGWQDFFGGDPRAQEQFEKLSGFGTDAGGLVGMIKASHGSPHAFTKFDMSKIGTGEGAQAYGHGMYFGEGFDSPVAQSYRTAGVPASEYQDKIFLKQYHADNARLRGDKEGEERALAALAELKANPPGHLYNVELRWPDPAREAADPLGEHHLLDWDAPLNEQPPLVRKALSGLNLPPGTYGENPVGAHAYAEMSKRLDQGDQELLQSVKQHPNLFAESPELVSAWLKSKGIPGIRYLDQGSRSAGTGSRNYVMFDDALANIVSRNGVSLTDLLRR